MVTGGTLTFLGDVICQNFIENTNQWDYLRSLRMGGFAVCVWSTVGYKWILLAEKWFPGRTPKSLFYKILIDQESFIYERSWFDGNREFRGLRVHDLALWHRL